MSGINGYIHSCESFGAVDGPGIRYVVFMQGCALRCLFCHNPDTWQMNDGKLVNSAAMAKEIATYKNFIKNGGVTLSGGEPLLQPEFCIDLIKRCKKKGLHTAVDTAGFASLETSKKVVDEADLILLDIKSLDEKTCVSLTGELPDNAKNLLEYCEKTNKPVWIRHVLVPNFTLNNDKLNDLSKYLTNFKCVQKIELLPFHKMGEYKWKELNLNYSLFDTKVPIAEEIETAKKIFESKNLPV